MYVMNPLPDDINNYSMITDYFAQYFKMEEDSLENLNNHDSLFTLTFHFW